MKIKLNVPITDLSGEPIKEANSKDYVTIGSACVAAVMNSGLTEKTEGKEKFERYQLANKIHNKPEIDLSIDEIAKIKGFVGAMYTPLVVGRIFDHFEGSSNEVEK